MAEKNMRCAFWREGDRCAKFSDDECDNFCVLGPCSAQVPSNADRIRAMSDEQLALAIRMTADCDFCPIKNCKARHYSSPNNCERHWFQWLQSPADGGDGDDM